MPRSLVSWNASEIASDPTLKFLTEDGTPSALNEDGRFR
jgi:hypothetical protein